MRLLCIMLVKTECTTAKYINFHEISVEKNYCFVRGRVRTISPCLRQREGSGHS